MSGNNNHNDKSRQDLYKNTQEKKRRRRSKENGKYSPEKHCHEAMKILTTPFYHKKLKEHNGKNQRAQSKYSRMQGRLSNQKR